MAERLERKLVLDDGNEYYGEGFGSSEDKICELIFDTSMVGTQELISDPAYLDKMVILTYPVAGSYGINDDDFCSRGASPAAQLLAMKIFHTTTTRQTSAARRRLQSIWRITASAA